MYFEVESESGIGKLNHQNWKLEIAIGNLNRKLASEIGIGNWKSESGIGKCNWNWKLESESGIGKLNHYNWKFGLEFKIRNWKLELELEI